MMDSISPSPAASEQQDLPSPGVGEDFRLRRRLDKSWEKYDVGFFAIRSSSYKGGPQKMHEGVEALGGTPQGVGAPPVPFRLRVSVCVIPKLYPLRFVKISPWYFSSN